MKMTDVIQGVSEIYRAKRSELTTLQKELDYVKIEINKAMENNGENITYERYTYLINRRDELIKEISLKIKFADGIAYAREYLMDIGFNVEVK